MVKIVHIANPTAGVGIYLDLLVRHSSSDIFTHMVLCNFKNHDTDFQFRNKYHIPLIRQIRIINDIKCLLVIIQNLKRIKPDVIHCHSAKAGILGRIAGSYLRIPTFYTPHAYSYLSAKSKINSSFYRSIEKLFRFFNSKTIACSPSEYNRTINELKFNKENVFLWNNSIDDDFGVEEEEVERKNEKGFLCSIGRPSYQKNTKLLVEAILEAKKEIKDIKLVILGAGFYSPDLDDINCFIKDQDLEDNIILISWLKRKEVISILRKSKLYISSSRYEGLPYAVIEAMALSKPCIVTEVDGNKDLIQDKLNGLLVKEDARLIAEAIIKLFSDDELLEKMSKKARNIFLESYNIKKNITKLENIYLSEIQEK